MAETTEKPEEQTPPKGKRLTIAQRTALVVSVVLLLGLGAGAVLAVQYVNDWRHPVAERQTPVNDGNVLKTSEEATVSAVAEKVSPSVVSIVTETTTSGGLFAPRQVQSGAGSGIIVSKDGVILTNKHVVKNARNVEVILYDGTTYSDVKVLGTDPLNDVAFLKIEGVSALKPAELGDSTTVKIGQRVAAIGNSLGQYQNTVTSGIISGKGRPIAAQDGDAVESLTDLLQTDAAINPGNSGGPLLNSSGQVIGINTAIAEDAEGIGFAIPINAVKGTLKGVLAGQGVNRAYLGVRYIPVDAAVAKKFELSVKTGAYVYSDSSASAVVSGSPADKAGIKKGDVIMKVNDVEIGARGSLSSLTAEYSPGETVEFTINRDGSERIVKVTLGSYDSQTN